MVRFGALERRLLLVVLVALVPIVTLSCVNLVLNARRKQLLDDFSSLALDARGRHAFDAFRQELRALQARMDAEPPAAWKVYPNILEANINA